MADSLFGSICSKMDSDSISTIAGALGEPQQAITRAVKSSIAAVLGGLIGNPMIQAHCVRYSTWLRRKT
jgi:hypothetical protein